MKALADTGKVDVIINFPLAMAINRLMKRNADIDPSIRSQLDECFGTSAWFEAAYHQQADLFNDELVLKKSDGASEGLLRLYLDRLRDLFGNVATPSLVRNTRNAPLYYLIFASSNSRGVPIADHILRMGDKISLRK